MYLFITLLSVWKHPPLHVIDHTRGPYVIPGFLYRREGRREKGRGGSEGGREEGKKEEREGQRREGGKEGGERRREGQRKEGGERQRRKGEMKGGRKGGKKGGRKKGREGAREGRKQGREEEMEGRKGRREGEGAGQKKVRGGSNNTGIRKQKEVLLHETLCTAQGKTTNLNISFSKKKEKSCSGGI